MLYLEGGGDSDLELDSPSGGQAGQNDEVWWEMALAGPASISVHSEPHQRLGACWGVWRLVVITLWPGSSHYKGLWSPASEPLLILPRPWWARVRFVTGSGESFAADSAFPGHPSLLVPLPSSLSPVLSDGTVSHTWSGKTCSGDLALS